MPRRAGRGVGVRALGRPAGRAPCSGPTVCRYRRRRGRSGARRRPAAASRSRTGEAGRPSPDRRRTAAAGRWSRRSLVALLADGVGDADQECPRAGGGEGDGQADTGHGWRSFSLVTGTVDALERAEAVVPIEGFAQVADRLSGRQAAGGEGGDRDRGDDHAVGDAHRFAFWAMRVTRLRRRCSARLGFLMRVFTVWPPWCADSTRAGPSRSAVPTWTTAAG